MTYMWHTIVCSCYAFRAKPSWIRQSKALVKNKELVKSTILWDITPCSSLVNRRFGKNISPPSSGSRISQARNNLCLPCAFTQVCCLAYSSALKMEAISSSETSVDTQRTTRRYIPEDCTLHNHRCENLESYKELVTLNFIQLNSLHKRHAVLQTGAVHCYLYKNTNFCSTQNRTR
jgi:hypothetical protein